MRNTILRKNNGITLIALVVTIIVLIILAGVSLNLVLGQNGIIQRAKDASKLSGESTAMEKLTITLTDIYAEKQLNSELAENDIDAILTKEGYVVNDNIVIVDGWQFEINRQTLKIVEKLGEETGFVKETRKKANFIYDSEATYLLEAEVEINIDESAKKYTVQYNTEENDENSSNWTTYTLGDKFKVSKNGTIYGRFINVETNEIGYKFKIEINNIDEIKPENASIELDKQVVNTGESINITVTMNDNESGILTSNCKYIVNETETEIGIDSTLWDSATAFASNPQTISVTKSEIKTYYLHVLSVDTAGNKIESISQKFRFKGVTTYLNIPSGRNWNNDVLTNEFGGFTKYNSATDLCLEVYYGNTAYLVSNQMYDITDISKLKFYCQCAGTTSSGCTGIVKLGLSKTKNSTELDEYSSATITLQQSELNMELDISQLIGSYYIKIVLESKGTTGRATVYGGAYIKGY